MKQTPKVMVGALEIAYRMGHLAGVRETKDFLNWLLDEIWDEDDWELNYQAFPELVCRKLLKMNYLRIENGEYVKNETD